VIPRSRRDLFKDQSFAYIYNTGTKADMWHAGGVLHAKKGCRGEKERTGNGAV
jgi:hypothetical protein